MRVAFASSAILASLAGAPFLLSPPSPAQNPCTVVNRQVALPELREASGLAVSRRHPGILWSHNDSGNEAVLFALDPSGVVRGRVRVPVRTRDWEDLSAAPCPSGDCLYLADIGDNGRGRPRIQIYRVPEPALDATETSVPEIFSASYPDGAHNAEALFVIDGSVFVVTKDRVGAVYRSTQPMNGDSELTLERVGQLGLERVTDAEASPDGESVVVRTAGEVVFYRKTDLLRGGAIPPHLRVSVQSLKEPQGEGVALDRDGVLYLVSEGPRGGRLTAVRCRDLPRGPGVSSGPS